MFAGNLASETSSLLTPSSSGESCANLSPAGIRLPTSRLVATISQRDDTGKVIGLPSVSLVGSKEEAKQRAKTLARSLGLKLYGMVDKTGVGDEPRPWLVPGVGDSV